MRPSGPSPWRSPGLWPFATEIPKKQNPSRLPLVEPCSRDVAASTSSPPLRALRSRISIQTSPSLSWQCQSQQEKPKKQRKKCDCPFGSSSGPMALCKFSPLSCVDICEAALDAPAGSCQSLLLILLGRQRNTMQLRKEHTQRCDGSSRADCSCACAWQGAVGNFHKLTETLDPGRPQPAVLVACFMASAKAISHSRNFCRCCATALALASACSWQCMQSAFVRTVRNSEVHASQLCWLRNCFLCPQPSLFSNHTTIPSSFGIPSALVSLPAPVQPVVPQKTMAWKHVLGLLT